MGEWELLQKGYPPEMHLNFESRETAFVHNLLLSNQIVLKVCIVYGSITALLCAKFRNHLATDMDVMDERELEKSETKISCGRYPVLQQPLGIEKKDKSFSALMWLYQPNAWSNRAEATCQEWTVYRPLQAKFPHQRRPTYFMQCQYHM